MLAAECLFTFLKTYLDFEQTMSYYSSLKITGTAVLSIDWIFERGIGRLKTRDDFAQGDSSSARDDREAAPQSSGVDHLMVRGQTGARFEPVAQPGRRQPAASAP